jgi:uncharacterized protein with HEPN domain
MTKRYDLFLSDILDSMNSIEEYIEGTDYDDFIANKMMVDAVLRNLEILGEAAKNVPDHVRAKYPKIPWRRMIGLRNIVVHEYFGVDLENIWKIITTDIPEIKPEISRVLDECKKKNGNGTK